MALLIARCTNTRSAKHKIVAGTNKVPPVSAAQQPTNLLKWLVDIQGATPRQLKIERAFLGDGRGFGLVAAADVGSGEVLLSVPLTSVVSSSADGWGADMAGQFLSQEQAGAEAPFAPWVASLPRHVPLPWLYWSEAEVAELQDAAVVAEAARLRQVLDAACEASTYRACSAAPPVCVQREHAPQAGRSGAHPPSAAAQAQAEVHRERMAWALSLAYSRSFVDRGTHICVPGIDMCNHSHAPNAGVRCVHSPDACQGAAATEEIAPPRPPSPSLFELMAGEAGIR